MLTALIDVKFDDYIKCPNLKNLYNILEIIIETSSSSRFNISLYFDHNERLAVLDCINDLLAQNLFKSAMDVAQIESLPMDLILLRKWHYLCENSKHRNDFFLQANAEFASYNVTADCVIEYFLTHAKKSSSNLEKYHLTTLAYEWARKYSLSSKYELEIQKWLAYVELENKSAVDSELFSNLPISISFKEMMEMLLQVTKCEEEISIQK